MLAVIAVVAVFGFASSHFLGFNPIVALSELVLSPIKSGFSYIARSAESGMDFIWEMRAYKADNEKLEAENIELKRQNRDIAAYREENLRLEGLLGLQEEYVDRKTVAARVISYSGNNWCEQIEINKGALSGIAEGNVVVTADGVVGRVTEVGADYSTVTTILDRESAVGVLVSRTGGTGLVEGDVELSASLRCKLSFLERDTPLIVGDIIETSGSGGIYPAGLVVGTVTNISADSTGSLNYAVIDPAVDMGRIGEVLVIL